MPDVSDTSLKWLTALVAAGLVAVVALGSIVGSRSVAEALRPASEQALAAAGLDGVSVTFEGREASLSGGSGTDLREAREVVEGVDGVRWARVVDGPDTDAQERVDASAPDASTIALERTSRGVAISGVVPDADAAAGIKAAVSLTYGVTVSGDLRVDPDVEAARWVGAFPGVLGDVIAVRDLQLTIDGADTARIRGTVRSTAGRDRVVDLLATAMPDLEVDDDLTIDHGGLGRDDAAVLDGTRIVFPTGAAYLTGQDGAALAAVADVMRRHDDVRIEVGAHVGPKDPEQGQVLGRDRAAAVTSYLVGLGIDPDRISQRTYASPSAGISATDERYRRVDLVVKEG
ncbi:OmpA family protein [Aeromicrobium sp. SMF47]|uniref:OmpA family protein n=1 Tax=Aeromicrobium TaxID=2040 RepID=UPI00129EF277|nr:MULTISPECIES: OmpA family protein [Aeromicrobium]MRJ78240.1 OmpA family protein [Aeromicrobium yanjiei]